MNIKDALTVMKDNTAEGITFALINIK